MIFAYLLRETYKNFTKHRTTFLAAALSFYGFLSLFPLILFIVSILGFFLQSARVQSEIFKFVSQNLPIVGELVKRNVQAVVSGRESIGVIGLLGLLWTGSAIFAAIEHALNIVWEAPVPRHILKHKILALLLIIGGALLVLASVFMTSFASSLRYFALYLFPGKQESFALLWSTITGAASGCIGTLTFFLIYRIIPNVPIRARDVWRGALVAGVGWEISKYIFSWYLRSLARYELLYGTLSVVIALLVLIYISALILLLGAELNFAYAELRSKHQ